MRAAVRMMRALDGADDRQARICSSARPAPGPTGRGSARSRRSAQRRSAISRRAVSCTTERPSGASPLRRISSAGSTSRNVTSSAPSNTESGMCSCTAAPVTAPTSSLRLSMFCTFTVAYTSIPALSSSATSWLRWLWRLPALFRCARSSTNTSVGARASTASRSISPSFASAGPARRSSAASRRAVQACPCGSTTPAATSVPCPFCRRACFSMAQVLPAPGA